MLYIELLSSEVALAAVWLPKIANVLKRLSYNLFTGEHHILSENGGVLSSLIVLCELL